MQDIVDTMNTVESVLTFMHILKLWIKLQV